MYLPSWPTRKIADAARSGSGEPSRAEQAAPQQRGQPQSDHGDQLTGGGQARGARVGHRFPDVVPPPDKPPPRTPTASRTKSIRAARARALESRGPREAQQGRARAVGKGRRQAARRGHHDRPAEGVDRVAVAPPVDVVEDDQPVGGESWRPRAGGTPLAPGRR